MTRRLVEQFYRRMQIEVEVSARTRSRWRRDASEPN